jgi:pantetheine-phosphate adenylyltransferase
LNNSSGRAAVFPGTFDPVTNGHLDIIKRASRLFERLLVGVAPREEKGVLFSLEERIAMIRGLTGRLSNVEVMPIHGLLVNFTRRHKVNVVIRGLRAVSDF